MLNFTVGPVMTGDEIRSIGGEQVPYFRTEEFSRLMLENEQLIKSFAGAKEDGRVVFLTGSGTAAMEAAVLSLFSREDRVLVVDGGSFGHRFTEILAVHGIPFTPIHPVWGHDLTDEDLAAFEGKGYTGFLVNQDETSVGVLYDLHRISAFCRRNGLCLVVDAISSFLADPFDLTESGAAAMITGSQKALACPPGISVIVLSPEGVERVMAHRPASFYLDLKAALKNGERGQTPFTPAVGILRQIHARLLQIEARGGAPAEISRVASLAAFFRRRLREEALPFRPASASLPGGVTPLMPPEGVSAYSIFLRLKEEYGIWVCPNGGDLKDKIFRVGHIGDLKESDFETLIQAFTDLRKRQLI